MTSPAGNGSTDPRAGARGPLAAFDLPPGCAAESDGPPDHGEVLPVEERKAAMSGLDPMEVKWSLGAFVLATIAGIAIPAYIIAENKITKKVKDTIAVAPDAKLLGGLLLLLCAIGFVALWKRKRTLVAFDLFLLGFGFTLFVGLFGFVFILLGGWLLLRAWRINKYGTTNSKAIARQVRDRPRGRQRKEAAKRLESTAKTVVKYAQTAHATSATRPSPPPGRRSPNPRNSFAASRSRLTSFSRRARPGGPSAAAGARRPADAPATGPWAPRPRPAAPPPRSPSRSPSSRWPAATAAGRGGAWCPASISASRNAGGPLHQRLQRQRS